MTWEATPGGSRRSPPTSAATAARSPFPRKRSSRAWYGGSTRASPVPESLRSASRMRQSKRIRRGRSIPVASSVRRDSCSTSSPTGSTSATGAGPHATRAETPRARNVGSEREGAAIGFRMGSAVEVNGAGEALV